MQLASKDCFAKNDDNEKEWHCQFTPKVFPNSSPGLLQPWGQNPIKGNSERVRETVRTSFDNTFGVTFLPTQLDPGLKQPWARISERLRRKNAWLFHWSSLNCSAAKNILKFSEG